MKKIFFILAVLFCAGCHQSFMDVPREEYTYTTYYYTPKMYINYENDIMHIDGSEFSLNYNRDLLQRANPYSYFYFKVN